MINYFQNIDKNNLPVHIAIIMDGNGRWAKKKGKPRVFGHKQGVKAVRNVIEACGELGIKYLTLYAFSTENWNRPKQEISTLMQLLVNTLNKELNNLNKNNIKLLTIGDIKQLPEECYKELIKAKEITKNNNGLNLVLALSYSARWEITKALKRIIDDILLKKIHPDEINQNIFANYLETKDIPDPELLIRTSGEYRISNFLLWQIAYCELYFTKKLWPDFKKNDLFKAVYNFQNRERRFGLTGEQLKLMMDEK